MASEVVLWHALLAMLPAWCVGWAVGALAVHITDSQIRLYKQARPIPSDYQVHQDVEIMEDDASEQEFTPAQSQADAASNQKAPATSQAAAQ